MAVTAPHRRTKNTEGRMPLREHLRELRRRVLVSAVAMVLGAIGGWFLAQPVMTNMIINPVISATKHTEPVILNYTTVAAAFNIQVKVAVYIGMVISSPVWIYQLWAFVTPGLTRKERRYSLWFVAFAVPLFLCGVTLAVLVLPKAIAIGSHFALKGTVSYPDIDTVITFATRLIIALGTAFLTPLFLVGLNMMGFLSGQKLGKQWRIAVFIAFLFAAVVSPSPEATQMIILALPLIALYAISVGVCLVNDRRRARRLAQESPFADGDYRPVPLDDLNPGDTAHWSDERVDPIDPPAPLDDIT